MPQPLSHSPDYVFQSTLIHLKCKDVDFPLGIAVWIVDIDIEMAWAAVGSGISLDPLHYMMRSEYGVCS